MATVYDLITERIVEKLQQGTIPWQKPWNTAAGLPSNLFSQKPYRGINVWMLGSAGYSSPYWLTFKQAKEISGHVRKGEQGCPVVFWKWPYWPEQAWKEGCVDCEKIRHRPIDTKIKISIA